MRTPLIDQFSINIKEAVPVMKNRWPAEEPLP
jgi:hypothetical protein